MSQRARTLLKVSNIWSLLTKGSMSHACGIVSKWSVHQRALSRRPLLTRQSTLARAVAGFSPSPLPWSIRPLLTGTGGEQDRNRYSSPTAPLFDISEYLLSGCSWKHAPSLPDFVGPLSIQATHDCRGRGLFTSADVCAGDILLVSNPFALSYDDRNSVQLYHMITSMAKQSSRALHQLASLAGYRDEVIVPPMEIFDPNTLYCNSAGAEMLEFDPQRIVNVMNANCFGGEVRMSDSEPANQLNGLWLLPSFINHSCTPNATKLFVGKALVILASGPIQANKEVTISYTDSFLPVRMRDEQLETLACGFFCECQRCIAERSLQDQLLDVSESFQALHDEAVDEVFSLVSGKCPAPLIACIELSKLFDTLSKKLEICDHVTSAQKQWILASYSYAFLAKSFADYLSGGRKPSLCVSSRALDLAQAMGRTVPGMLRTLSFVMLLATALKQQGSNPVLIERLDKLARDECIRVYGNQNLAITLQLMERSLDAIPYV